MDDIAIKVERVYKDFKLPHEKTGTVKSAFTGMFRAIRKSRTYETQHALRDISFEIKKGEFFGVVGRNGSGKSTLLKMLAGIYQPNKGKITVNGHLVPFIELGVGFNGELTGRENVYLNGALQGFTKKEIDAKYDEIVAFAELAEFMDQKLKNYSSGMQVRLAFSLAIQSNAQILLVDEVLAVGDSAFQRKCLEYFKELKRRKNTVVFVSHDMGAVQQYCDRAVLIEKAEIVSIGRPAMIASKYHKMFAAEDADKEARTLKDQTVGISGEERWGDGKAKILSVKAEVDNPGGQDGDGQVIITAEIQAQQDLEKPIVGFSIKNTQLAQLLGTNTWRKKHEVGPLKVDETLVVQWRLENMFNEGTYYVDSTIAYDEATTVADRWPDAASFKIYREDNTPYQVYPDIKVKTSIIK